MLSRSSVSTLKLTPMTKAEAATLVDRMLGSYPSLSLHDPETYIGMMCVLLCGYPLWAGESAVTRAIASKDAKYTPPTQAVIKPILEDEVRVHRYAADWHAGAEQQLLALAAPEVSLEDRKAFIAQRRAEFGQHFGLDTGRPRPPSREESRQALIGQIGQAAFEALPDVPGDAWKKLHAPDLTQEPAP
jgi:hypothetical protein